MAMDDLTEITQPQSQGPCPIWNIRSKRILKSLQLLIVSKFNTEHGNNTAVCYAKFENDWATAKKQIVGKREVAKLGFDMRFGWISHIAQIPTHPKTF